jgi:hypothetical protein
MVPIKINFFFFLKKKKIFDNGGGGGGDDGLSHIFFSFFISACI